MLDLRFVLWFCVQSSRALSRTRAAGSRPPCCALVTAIAAGPCPQGLTCHRVIKAPWRKTVPGQRLGRCNAGVVHRHIQRASLMSSFPPATTEDRPHHHFHTFDINIDRLPALQSRRSIQSRQAKPSDRPPRITYAGLTGTRCLPHGKRPRPETGRETLQLPVCRRRPRGDLRRTASAAFGLTLVSSSVVDPHLCPRRNVSYRRCHRRGSVRRGRVGYSPPDEQQSGHQEDCALRSFHVRIAYSARAQAAEVLRRGGRQ